VVLHEPREPILVVETRPQVLAHEPRVSLAQPVVEALVVGVVEALLHHRRLGVPVDPGAFEDLRQNQHRHVAAHGVALLGDHQQFADHRLLRRRIRVVEL